VATSSIFTNIHITDEASRRSLLEAIESSRDAKKEEAVLPTDVRVVNSKDEIRELAKQWKL
jgi:hypothetical protein